MVSCGIDPGYFLDEMSTFEAESCLSEFIENRHVAWERVRTICFYSYFTAPGADRNVDMFKMMPFSWDEKVEVIKPTEADKKRLAKILKLT